MAAFDFRLTGINDEDIARAGGSLRLWVSLPGVDGAHPAAWLFTSEGAQPADATLVEEAELAHWAASPAIARSLLAAAYQAIATGEPFLMVAEPAFAYGWIRFLWLTLPPAWSESVPFLSYARQPFAWSPAPTQTLVAGIPREEMATLLQRTRCVADPANGDYISEGRGVYQEYARHVVDFLTNNSSRLADLRSRIAGLLPDAAVPSANAISLLPLAVSLALRDPLRLPAGDLPVDASQFYRPDDLPSLFPGDLIRLVRIAPGLRQDLWRELETLTGQTPSGLGTSLPPAEWDAWMREDPGTALQTLLVIGYWEEWHRETKLDAPSRRRAAQAWCASPYWQTHEPFFEHWKAIVHELSWLPAAEVGSMPYPVIEWFAKEQEDDLAHLPRQAPVARNAEPAPASPPPVPAPPNRPPFEDTPQQAPGPIRRFTNWLSGKKD